MMIASHWKIAFLILQLSLLAIMITSGIVFAGDPIDNPGTPI
jgi:hypothetical protein